ncbi:DMT family transporter [Sphingobium sp. YR768]|uniref:DMT family transporter n=1 Tax=Sphingobium sp. YR768 TaxID=1884365 RepID=UPI0008B4ECB9|nr:DMT family transporter [Sphingobium sp. YR768]SER63779.1 Permease of the drug/metabolite transporter (DMT) superfamily [Sphingobium sp. YR768]
MSRTDNSNIYAGIACGMGAGALWGLVFLAPEVIRGFSPLQQAVGRYLAYGALSLILIAPRWRSIAGRLTPRLLWALAWLALAGNLFYYVLLASAVQMGGIAMTSLVVGFLPVAVTIIGSREAGALPLRQLAPSLLLCVAGALCIGWQAVVMPGDGPVATRLTGFFCAVGALLSWTAFAIGNNHWLRRQPDMQAQDWNLLIGLATGAQALLFLPVVLLIGLGDHDAAAWTKFASVSFAVALLASIVGNALWNRMSRLLPLTMVGQMILFETGFALLYGFLWEQRLPTPLEGTAFALVIGSVITCIAAHRRPVAADATIAA